MKKIVLVYRYSKKFDVGVANSVVITDAELPLSLEKLEELKNHLKKKYNFKRVILLNYFQVSDDYEVTENGEA